MTTPYDSSLDPTIPISSSRNPLDPTPLLGKEKKSFAEKLDSFLNWGVGPDNPIDNALFGTPEERQKKQIEFQNRDKNLLKIVQSGFGLRDTPEAQQIKQAWKEGMNNADAASYKTTDDITHMFGKSSLSDLDEWAESIRPKGATVGERAKGAGLLGIQLAKGLVEMPIIMAEQLFNSTYVPVDLSKTDITPLTIDQISEAQKGTLANIAAMAIAPSVSKAMGALHEGLAASAATGGEALTTEGAANFMRSTVKFAPEKVAAAATQKYAIGTIGRAVLDDFTAGATSGMAWGAIQNANEEDTVAGMMSGLMLAPIGVATGFVRGVRSKIEGEVLGPDKIPSIAKNTLYANHLRITNETSVKSAINTVRSVLKASDFAEAVLVGEASVHPNSFVVLNGTDNMTADAIKHNFAGLETIIHTTKEGTRKVMVLGPELQLSKTDRLRFEVNGEHPRNIGTQIVHIDGLPHEYVRDGTPYYSYEGEQTANSPETSLGRPKLVESVIVKHQGSNLEFAVPADKVRWNIQAAQDVGFEPVIRNMFNEFESKFGFDGETSFQENVRKFLAEKGHSEKIEAFSTVFSDMLKKKYPGEAMPSNIQRYANEQLEPRLQLLSEADTNGFYIHEVGANFEVRDMKDSKKLFTGKTINEVRKFMKEAGQTKGEELVPTSIPTQAVGTPSAPPPANSVTNNPFSVPDPVGSSGWSRWVARFDAKHPAITAFFHHLDGHDVLYGTNFGDLYRQAREVYNKMREEVSTTLGKDPDIQLFKNMVEGMSPEKRELLVARMETMSPDEIRSAYGMTGKAQQIANDIVTSGEDIHQIQKYKRISEGILQKHQQRAEQTALAEFARMDKQNLSPGEIDNRMLEIVKKFREAATTSPAYLADIAALNAEIKPSPAFMKGVQDLTALPAEQQSISRLADALADRENYGLTQAEFDNKHGFSSMDKAVAVQMEKLYGKFGRQFGIENHRLVPHYVNHYRSYGDVYEPNLDALQAGMAVKGIRKFASEMVRTGEIVTYHRDPLQVVQAYIRSGIKGKAGGFYQTMDGLSKKFQEEQIKIPDQIARNAVGTSWTDFDAVLSGRNVLDADRANQIQMQYLRNKGMNPRQVADVMAQPSGLASVLALTNSSLMGGRLVMGMRDAYTAISTFYMFNGLERTVNFLKQSVDLNTMKRLQETGVISLVDYSSIYENQLGKSGAAGTAAGVTKKLADLGFKWSLQGHVNTLAQGAAYMESMHFTAPLIDQVLKKKITMEEFKKKVFFNSFDEHVRKSVDNHLVAGNAEATAHALSIASRDRVAGQFGVGSGTSGGSGSFGKIFNQMGSWSIQNRSVMMKAFSKGTLPERLHVGRRLLTSQAAMLAAGGVAGFNLSSWVLGPGNLMFFGGPLIGAAQTIKAATDATLGGSYSQKEYAYRQAQRTAYMAVPFGYAIRSLKMAYDLSQGTGFGLGRIAGQAVGLNVKKEEGYRSWWDEWTNNYPTLR